MEQKYIVFIICTVYMYNLFQVESLRPYESKATKAMPRPTREKGDSLKQ